jgi:HD superfamily phosphohydrolase
MEIRDPIHGFIEINELEKAIIDSYPFQRLRRIQSLGFTHMAYPGATHSRFEHSLGVMHLAGSMFDVIMRSEKNRRLLKYSTRRIKEEQQLVRLAGLLHDIGHGPLSHVAEDVMPIKEGGESFTHEDYTIAIIRESCLRDVIEDNEYNKKELGITPEQIADFFEKGTFWNKSLISSQLDADRGDYLLRDSHHIGVTYGIYDHWRLLNTLTLGPGIDNAEIVLGVDKEGVHVVESFIFARYLEYNQITYHKTRRAYDFHLKRAMKTILRDKLHRETLPPPGDIEEYLKLDDLTILAPIVAEKESNEDYKAIVDRKHIRCVYSDDITKSTDERGHESFKCESLETVKSHFEQAGVPIAHIDKIQNEWYKKGEPTTEKPTEEIMVFSEGAGRKKTAQLLSAESCIIKNIGSILKWRLYVRLQVKREADKCIQNMLKIKLEKPLKNLPC